MFHFHVNVYISVFFQFVVFSKIAVSNRTLRSGSGAINKLIDVFIEFINKESVLYTSILEYICDACSEVDIRVETIHSELSC